MIVDVTNNLNENLFLVDCETGQVSSIRARLVHIPDHALNRLSSDPGQAIRYAMAHGVDLLVDSDEFVGADMLTALHPVPDGI